MEEFECVVRKLDCLATRETTLVPQGPRYLRHFTTETHSYKYPSEWDGALYEPLVKIGERFLGWARRLLRNAEAKPFGIEG
jgi:hypothetical protein